MCTYAYLGDRYDSIVFIYPRRDVPRRACTMSDSSSFVEGEPQTNNSFQHGQLVLKATFINIVTITMDETDARSN